MRLADKQCADNEMSAASEDVVSIWRGWNFWLATISQRMWLWTVANVLV